MTEVLSKIDGLISHSGAAREDVVEQYLLKNDLSYFAERILGMEIVNHHKEWSELVANDPRIAINASRDHGKSYFFCFAYVLWRAFYHWIPPSLGADFKSIPRISLGYIFSNTQDQAIKHLEIVKHELETNDKLFHLVPDKKENWSKQEIRLANGAIIRARGWGVSVRGAHPCLSYNSLIVTENGVEAIGSLVGKKRKILTGAGTWKDAIFWSSGIKPVIGSEYGSKYTRDKTKLCLTQDHRVLAQHGWSQSRDLLEGQQMRSALSEHNLDFVFAGWYWNDGSYKKGAGQFAYFSEKDAEALDLFRSYFTKKPEVGDGCSYRVAKSKIDHIVQSIGRGSRQKCRDKGLPVLMSAEEKVAWIRGMFSANGMVVRSVRIKLANLELVQFIERILHEFGCRTAPIVKDINRHGHVSYLLHLHKRSIGQYLSVFGFIQSYKTELAEDLKFRFYQNVLLPKEQEVFDFSVIDAETDLERSGVVDGIVVHNCWVVCDDVLNEENLYSEITRRKEKDYMFSAVTPMLIPGGQLTVVGTPLHNDDLYADLKQNRSYNFKTYPACDENFGQVLWPTRYPKERLMKIRDEVGSTRFAREYRSIPISDDSSLFPERIISECYDSNFEMPNGLTEEERTKLQVYTGVDLAMSATVGADYTVITTIGLDQYKNRWILDIRRKKGLSMTEQLREIEDVYRNFGSQKILIEDNNFQRVFKDELVKRTDMPVEGFTTTRYNKNSMEKGVPSLQILFENKKFVIARKTTRDRRITDILVHELRCFSWQDGKLAGIGAHDDCVMSLWMANESASTGAFSFTFA